MRPSGGITTSRSRWASGLLVHPPLKVVPPPHGDGLVGIGKGPRGLLEDVEQDEEPIRPSVQDSEETAAVVTAQLPELARDLAAVRKWQRRISLREIVETIDLEVKRSLHPGGQPVDEVIDGLVAMTIAVVDGVHFRHGCKHGRQRFDY